MSYFRKKRDVKGQVNGPQTGYPLLDESNGCVAGFKVGITHYTSSEYSTPGVHEDQEGFVVLAGHGWARIGDEECAIEPDTCFVAPAGVPHTIKRDLDSGDVVVCWFHGAIG